MQLKSQKFKPDFVFICHYFPPQNNAGVRRVSFWANHYVKMGKKVLIITTKKVDSHNLYLSIDDRVKVLEYSFISDEFVKSDDNSAVIKPTGGHSSKNGGESALLRFFLKLKRVVFNKYIGQIADNRVFSIATMCVKNKLGLLNNLKYLINFDNAVFISSAPPWPMHLLGISLSKKFNRPLYLDYRDQFSANHMFSSNLSFLECKLDKYICSKATGIIVVSPSMANYYRNFNSNILDIKNGYDSDSFDVGSIEEEVKFVKPIDEVIEINYFGSIEHKTRLPTLLFSFLKENQANVRVNFYGSCSLVAEYIKGNKELERKVRLHGMVPHKVAMDCMKSSQINLLSETLDGSSLCQKGVMTTKMYEYMASKRPILAIISDESDMAGVLENSGLLINIIKTKDELRQTLDWTYLNSLTLTPNQSYIKKLSRQSLADELINRLEGSYIES